MKTLNYETLKQSNYEGYLLEDAPVRVLQFGEGNFMRGFVDYFIDQMNEKAGFDTKVTLVQPISQGAFRLKDIINEQEGLYTLYLQGFQDGQEVREKRVISAVKNCLNAYEDWNEVLDMAKKPDLRFITCNTTEAGIAYDPTCQFADAPAASYPAKLTQFCSPASSSSCRASSSWRASSSTTTARNSKNASFSTPKTGTWAKTSFSGSKKKTCSARRWSTASSPAIRARKLTQ